jgi:3'-phosphoadenosine 5'-phosphosulfate sulfotransferase (PAPS reductase)/FAD synthetase
VSNYHLDHLQHLETEAIHVMREVAGEFERPALLFSGGKDSICLLRLAEKAFRPAELPMPLLNVDTGHHFPELNEFRDRRAAQLGAKLIIRKVEDAIAAGIKFPRCSRQSKNFVSTAASAELAAMKRKLEPRNVSSVSATASASGIRKTSARRSGIYSTAV